MSVNWCHNLIGSAGPERRETVGACSKFLHDMWWNVGWVNGRQHSGTFQEEILKQITRLRNLTSAVKSLSRMRQSRSTGFKARAYGTLSDIHHRRTHLIRTLMASMAILVLWFHYYRTGNNSFFQKGSSVTRPKEWSQVKQVKQRGKNSYEANPINKKGGQQFQQHLTYKANPINRPEIKSPKQAGTFSQANNECLRWCQTHWRPWHPLHHLQIKPH